jgi:hypothetical protein
MEERDMPATSEATLIAFRGGFVAEWTVVCRLLALEARGARFELKADGGFRVVPAEVLTADDTAFLRQHRDAARRVLEYQPEGQTTDLREALQIRKPEALAVVSRLEAMRRHGVDWTGADPRRPVARARLDACGGPGFCFSCGDALEHPDGYGRCPACDLATDLFYASLGQSAPQVA